jgi:hypothetical protein
MIFGPARSRNFIPARAQNTVAMPVSAIESHSFLDFLSELVKQTDHPVA